MGSRKVFGVLVGAVILFFGTAGAQAQQTESRVDIFAGYSFLSNGFGEFRVGNHGWNLQPTLNLSPNVGLTADFSGHNATTTPLTGVTQMDNMYTFLFGPKLTHHEGNFQMYVHGLVGVMRAHTAIEGDFSTTDTGFAAAAGGGVDWLASDRWGVRILQLDYIYGNPQNADAFGPTTVHNVRLSTGVIVRW